MKAANPYRFTTPVEKEMFFGRQENIETLIKYLVGEPGESVALIGGRRMGKTSVLEKLQRSLKTHIKESTPNLLPLSIYVDFNGENVNSVTDFFNIVSGAAQEKLPDLLATLSANTPAIIGGQSPARAFQRIIEEWEQIVMKQRGQRLRLILLLDECEQIVKRSWTPKLYGALRSVLQGATTRSLLKIVMAGSHCFLARVRQRGSPLRNVLADPITLHVLDAQATDELINQPTGDILHDEVVEAVDRQSGRHPFLTQYIMYHLWEHGLENVTSETVQIVASQFSRRRPDFQDWANSVGTFGLKVYGVLSQANKTLSEAQIRATLRPPPTELLQTLDTLCYYGLIERGTDGESYRVAGQMFREWFESAFSNLSGSFVTNDKPVVFISYSHDDEEAKDKLLTHLGVLTNAGLIDVWSDDRIRVGTDWEKEISEAIAGVRVAILLISANFLTSDFILRKEVPKLLERRTNEGLTVFPVIIKACAWREVDWLRKMNVRPKNGKPVWSDGGIHVDEYLATIAEEVANIVK